MSETAELQGRAERLVAENIEAWGWGPLSEIEGLAEHQLAVDAAKAALAQQEAVIAGLAKKLAQRRSIYLTKRDREDDLADDTLTEWEKYDFAAEVVEWVASDLEIELPERAEAAGER